MEDTLGPRREGFISARSITDYSSIGRPFLFDISSRMVIGLQVTISRIYFYLTGRFAIRESDEYDQFVNTVINREKGVPLITVSNHRSVADDPLIMSCILPYHLNIQPKYLRYGLCSQEYCFNPKFPSIVSAYIGLGHVLPIWRGGGINQKLLLDFARLCAAGEWVHIFPEAGVWQQETLGGRGSINARKAPPNSPTEGSWPCTVEDAGKLKWGVGKLIAHAPKKPIVIPFFHSGMETVYPHNPADNVVMHRLPRPGQDVVVRFGEPIDFDDLIQEHEETHGPLWHYSESTGEKYEEESTVCAPPPVPGPAHPPVPATLSTVSTVPSDTSSVLDSVPVAKEKNNLKISQNLKNRLHKQIRDWTSKPAELRLYSKITKRIEQAIRKLNEESNKELSSR